MEPMLELRAISKQNFALYGLKKMAYLKPVPSGELTFFAVHAADGTFLCQYCDRETACAALRQHDIEPASVH